MFELLLTLCAAIAGAVASVTGFGIGSILTPVLALQVGTKLAVAAISIPHLIATTTRFWLLKAHVDKTVLLGFGVMSAFGGLSGALLHSRFGGPVLTMIFAVLLLFAGFTGVTGLAQKLHFEGKAAWPAGFFSGLFGGLVGNQGGIRSAAMLGFGLTKESFVATNTAIGIIVDVARMPVYLVTEYQALIGIWHLIAWATLGVMLGTYLGLRLLKNVSLERFKKIVSGFILLLGIYMFIEGVAGL